MPLAHLGITVQDISKARAFYEAALKPLGYTVQVTFLDDKVLGLGEHYPDFWISEVNARKTEEEKKALPPQSGPAGEFIHLAFSAKSRDEVDQFYEAAIAAGAKDNGAPGLRPHYGPTYYGAFVYDIEGRNLEAVYLGEA
ncbi:hypothetical protein JR316_0012453 [Psilocybe cubensis]|uniref:VOC domain-containing protein n=2 Tax=Psilocybe cubensis TaxID=181762 RepID=A0A8H7XNQ4_PSICU|nr:hypothetical protein JR316_0012453 [Psilocybe cubensis]KAH9475342.1 hypothetical protein JR316_0012453 [Psilocybe cubensis]